MSTTHLQVLLSAMNLKDESYVDSLNITSDAVVVNQCRDSKGPEGRASGMLSVERIRRLNALGEKHEVTYIESLEKGLSRSRNMAMDQAVSDICIFCDNDVEYVPLYDSIILKAFEKYQDADVIVFYIKRKEKPVPNFPGEKRMGYLSVLKIFSPEIAFRRKNLAEIRFDPRFGAGAKYCMGEENIFLYECLKKHKKIIYVPVKIASLREEPSTWFKGYDKQFFISRGAGYAAMTKSFSSLLILQFALRKQKLYGGDMKLFDAIRYMFMGKKEFDRERYR